MTARAPPADTDAGLRRIAARLSPAIFSLIPLRSCLMPATAGAAGRQCFRRRLFVTTLTLLSAMAAPATIGSI